MDVRREAAIIVAMKSVVDLRVMRALKAVQAEPARHFKVAELAKLAGASRAAFVRLFRAATGTSPQRFLRGRRLQRAAELLLTTDETLAQIAARVGYESEFSLSRAFKQRFGLSPSRYREQAQFTIRAAA